MKGKPVAVVVEGNVHEQFICYENVKNPGIPVRSSWLCLYVGQFWCKQIVIGNLLFAGTSPVQGWCGEGFPGRAQHSALAADLLMWPPAPQRSSSSCVPLIGPGRIPEFNFLLRRLSEGDILKYWERRRGFGECHFLPIYLVTFFSFQIRMQETKKKKKRISRVTCRLSKKSVNCGFPDLLSWNQHFIVTLLTVPGMSAGEVWYDTGREMTKCNSLCQCDIVNKTVPICLLSICPPFYFLFLVSYFLLISVPLFLPLLCPDSGIMPCLSVFLALCLPDFHPPLWIPVPGKGPQLILLLCCSSGLVSYDAQDECSWWTQEAKMVRRARRQGEWAWVWAACLADVITSWVGHCLLTAERTQSSSGSKASGRQGLSM